MKGKFLDNATKKYNSAYGKMKTGGTTKMKKYQGDRSQVTTMSGPKNPMESMSTASKGTRTSMMDTGKRTPRSTKIMNRAVKNWTKAENLMANPGTYGEDVASRLYKRASRQEARAKKVRARGK